MMNKAFAWLGVGITLSLAAMLCTSLILVGAPNESMLVSIGPAPVTAMPSPELIKASGDAQAVVIEAETHKMVSVVKVYALLAGVGWLYFVGAGILVLLVLHSPYMTYIRFK